jgi:hypothetical protein
VPLQAVKSDYLRHSRLYTFFHPDKMRLGMLSTSLINSFRQSDQSLRYRRWTCLWRFKVAPHKKRARPLSCPRSFAREPHARARAFTEGEENNFHMLSYRYLLSMSLEFEQISIWNSSFRARPRGRPIAVTRWVFLLAFFLRLWRLWVRVTLSPY